MKLGYLFISNQSMGGVYQYSLSTLEALSKNKKIKEIIVYSNQKQLNLKNVKFIYIENYKFLYFLSILLGFLNFFPRFLFKDIDLIFSPTYSPVLFFSKAKIVFTLHDLQEKYYPENFTYRTLIWRKYIYSKMLKITSIIITESGFVKKDFINYLGFEDDKINVIESPPYFDKVNFEKKSGDEFLSFSNINYDYIFFPAQFWRHKNHLRVLKAFSLLSKEFDSIKIILTGKKNREYRSIVNLIKELKIKNKVVFFHEVPQKMMPYFFKNSLFTIAPTLHESISIPVFEAFQYGSPVCASGILAIKHQVSDAGLLFNPSSVESIYECIVKLLKENELRERLKIKGFERNKFFSTKRFNKKFNKVL